MRRRIRGGADYCSCRPNIRLVLLIVAAIHLSTAFIMSETSSSSSFVGRVHADPSASQACPTKRRKLDTPTTTTILSSSSEEEESSNNAPSVVVAGKLEELKQREAELASMLAEVRREKLSTLRSRPLSIGVIGFGRFGQFIARSFQKYGRVVVTSRSDYTDIANAMGVTYVPLATPEVFLEQDLDVIVVAVSIMSFEQTIRDLVPHLRKNIESRRRRLETAEGGGDASSDYGSVIRGPLIVDVLSVKEHARQIMLDLLPAECDILCTHPMFGPDSGKDGWTGLTFVYEKTRINQVVLDPRAEDTSSSSSNKNNMHNEEFVDSSGTVHSVHEDSEAHVEGMDRMERFLSIWEEEGCRMIPLSCRDHDAYAANSQFVTHLMGRILGSQGLSKTPIDTKGFQSVLKLIDGTTADSFDLFYGLYKFNQNSQNTIVNLREAMDEVVEKLRQMEQKEG